MKKFIVSFALSMVALVAVNATRADGPPKSGYGGGSKFGYGNYAKNYGTSFAGGICYQGKNHSHWSSCYFDNSFGCYLYQCPSTETYYYWCGDDACYYPTTYCPHNTYSYTNVCFWPQCPVYCPPQRPYCPTHNNFPSGGGSKGYPNNDKGTGGINTTKPAPSDKGTGGINTTKPGTGGINTTKPGTGGINTTKPGTGGINTTKPGTGGINTTKPGTGGINTTKPGGSPAGTSASNGPTTNPNVARPSAVSQTRPMTTASTAGANRSRGPATSRK